MASLTFSPVATRVNILHRVALDARRADVPVAFACVAGGAANGGMRTLQPKSRLGVIERPGMPPVLLLMTVAALFTEASLVRIICLMAGEASCRGGAELHRRQVAAVAPHGPMRALQIEVGRRVTERLPIKLDYVSRAALVIGVAVIAFIFRRLLMATVKAGAEPPVLGDLLVTGYAQARLRVPREGFVALVAVAFELGMPADQRSRHNEALEHVLCSRD